jgi:hypothetical protein
MEPAQVLELRPEQSTGDESQDTQRFRDVMHEELDKFLDRLMVVFETDQKPTVADLSDLMTENRQDFLGSCLQHLIEEEYSDSIDLEEGSCPRCGKTCTNRQVVRKKLDTMQGSCEQGFAPLDAVAEISRRGKQFDVQKRAVKLAAQLPFATASEFFEDLTGLKASDHFIHELFEEVADHAGLEMVVPDRDEIDRRIASAWTGKWRPVLAVASDGAHLPTRPKARRNAKRGRGQYKEAKGFRIYLVSKNRIVHVASRHQIQDEDQFGVDLALVAGRIPQSKVRMALLGDGADWLWKHMTACFPGAREVLDFYHCSEHLHEVAKAQYGEKSADCLQWVEATLCRLFYGEVGHVVAGCVE